MNAATMKERLLALLPALRRFDWGNAAGVVANNGAAGMPNFAGERAGLVTRIALAPSADAIYGMAVRGAHVEAVPVRYDHARWVERFLASWPAGTPAHRSYFRRIAEGPRFTPRDALAA